LSAAAELRRRQNEYAELRKQLKPDEPKAVEQKEQVNTDHHKGTIKKDEIYALSERNYGLSAEVSRGNRPKHFRRPQQQIG
jgi:hypothetical protein